MNTLTTLEFDQILNMLADCAVTENAKRRCVDLRPTMRQAEARRWMEETTQAKTVLTLTGTPPLPPIENLMKALALVEADAMLLPEDIGYVTSFLVACRRMKQYLKKAETTGVDIAFYGASIEELGELAQELERRIINGAVDDKASPALSSVRRQMTQATEQIKHKLETLLRNNKGWFSESYVTVKNGHFTLPVKREHKSQVSGTLIDMSNSGGTCFIEPSSVGKLNETLHALEVEEDCEVRRILYELTALIGDELASLRRNIEAIETLDFLFAKGKLSLKLAASPVLLTTDRTLNIMEAIHPLLDKATAVPLDFNMGNTIRGVVVTGPNTGGKTVAMKTVGLLSLMAQCGLHVPASPHSTFAMFSHVLCDIGDGQSISENLSTFSSHMKNVIAILEKAGPEALVLLDELGSGTDPAEGMGLAVAILEELSAKGCLFLVTTHYPEVKEFALTQPGLMNARMAFDKESLLPLYRLELGEAGESCALYIAQRLGLQDAILARARMVAYGNGQQKKSILPVTGATVNSVGAPSPQLVPQPQQKIKSQAALRSERFNIGDSVMVYPQKQIGLIYQRANEKGELGVQIKGVKTLINHKRLKLHVSASELYPEDYDFSIVFDSVSNRKARHLLDKRHEEGTIVVLKEGAEG